MGTGLASFQRRFQQVPQDVRAAVAPELVAAAEDVAATIRQLAPKDEGDMAASVAVTGPGEVTPPYSQPGGSLTVPDGQAAVTVGNSDVRYPHLVEFGTAKAAAKPFFFSGYRLARAEAAKRIKAGIRRAIRGQK